MSQALVVILFLLELDTFFGGAFQLCDEKFWPQYHLIFSAGFLSNLSGMGHIKFDGEKFYNPIYSYSVCSLGCRDLAANCGPHHLSSTVCGPISPSSLGITLTHEHLSHRFNNQMLRPCRQPEHNQHLATSNYDHENLWWIAYHPYSSVDNLRFDDIATREALREEMNFYWRMGGRTIVENSTFGRDLNFLAELSRNSSVNIVAGTGYYVGSGQPASNLSLTTEKMYTNMKDELLEGVSSIRCGFIGEIGTSYPVTGFEQRSLAASGQVQEELKVPAMIHCARHKNSPFESLRIFLEAGGRARMTVMAHLERTLFEDELLLQFAELGTFCEFDLFGLEVSYYTLADDLDMPSDANRIERIKVMIKEGHAEQVLISQDIHTKHRLMKFGGHGFSHVICNVVPKMKLRGVSQELIDQIIIKNPKSWLSSSK